VTWKELDESQQSGNIVLLGSDAEAVYCHGSEPGRSYQTDAGSGLDEPLIFLQIQEQNLPLQHDIIVPSVASRRSSSSGVST